MCKVTCRSISINLSDPVTSERYLRGCVVVSVYLIKIKIKQLTNLRISVNIKVR